MTPRRALAALCLGAMSVAAAAPLAPAGAQTIAAPREGFADLVERLSPAVVNIRTRQNVDGELPAFPPGSPLERFNDYLGGGPRTESSLGSGFVIDADGIVVTNNHVIDDADEIEVVFPDGATLAAQVVGRDPATDLAVLRVSSASPLPVVPFGDPAAARVGDWVIAIGNPFGLGNSVSVGVISARNRDIEQGRYDDFIQTDAAINRGNSGGPLFDLNGEVIGVNSAILSPSGGSVGIGFSIPADLTQQVISQLLEFGETRRGWLGVGIQRVTQEIAESYGLDRARGALINRVTAGGPAAEAGLAPGDLIVSFNGRDVGDERDLARIVAETGIGERAALDFVRERERRRVSVVVARLDEGDTRPRTSAPAQAPVTTSAGTATAVGVTMAPLTDALRSRYRIARTVTGVVVIGVAADVDAAGKVREGDVIEEVAFQAVSDPEEAAELARAEVAAGRPVLMMLNRSGELIFQPVRGGVR